MKLAKIGQFVATIESGIRGIVEVDGFGADGRTGTQNQEQEEAAIVRDMAVAAAKGMNEKWSMNFVIDRLEDGRYFRILTVVDQYSRECLALQPAVGMTGEKVAAGLAAVVEERGKPKSFTVDNGSEFYNKAMDRWSYQNGARLCQAGKTGGKRIH